MFGNRLNLLACTNDCEAFVEDVLVCCWCIAFFECFRYSERFIAEGKKYAVNDCSALLWLHGFVAKKRFSNPPADDEAAPKKKKSKASMNSQQQYLELIKRVVGLRLCAKVPTRVQRSDKRPTESFK